MEDFSEENIRKNCFYCDLSSSAYTHPLEQTPNFCIICDANVLEPGHIVIVSKSHLACVGEYPVDLHDEFLKVYKKAREFVLSAYGSVASFEHGKFGQSAFHSHVQLLPFDGSIKEIIPEGEKVLHPLESMDELRELNQRDGGYLFVSIEDTMWTVSPSLNAPRFFRDRFATALGVSERGDWKAMRHNEEMMKVVKSENFETQKKWTEFVGGS